MAGETQPRVGTVGARLRAAREVKRLSVHAIATTTKVPVGALNALEEDDVARLPGGIFSRGFVRSYAAAVGLNPEQTVRDFVAQLPAHESATDAVSDDRPHGYHRSTRQWLVAGLVLGGVLVCSAGATLLFVVGIPGLPTRTDTPPGPAVAMAPEPALSPRLAVPVRELPSPTIEPVPHTIEPVPHTIEPVPQAPLTIVLRPRRDCWVSLRIDGESVVRRVMRAGEQETYGGRAEIILNVGDAGAFAFAINQRAGRALGASGQVVTVRLTPQNYADYVEP